MKRDRQLGHKESGQARKSHKTIWHPLSLQQLQPRQFVDVVNTILNGGNELCQGTLQDANGTEREDRLAVRMQELSTAH